MDHKQARALIEKYLSGNCTPAEQSLVESLYDQEIAERQMLAEKDEIQALKAAIWAGTQQQISKNRKSGSSRWWLAAAASVVLVMGTGLWFYQPLPEPIPVVNPVSQRRAIEPASQKATLTLSDGRKIKLDDAKKGEISHQAGQKIIKLGDGNVAYAGEHHSAERDIAIYNTLTTPRAAYYHLTLADGTQVWLNAASSITYPASFSGSQRNVAVTGEAYFEVAKDPHKPFIVKTARQIIRVLGTHFNVMTYDNEPQALTTLLEGSVHIQQGRAEALLKPGDQAAGASGGIKVSRVNVSDVVAWKNGFFKFDNETLGSIMKKLTRWYDVEVTFKDGLDQKKFWGTYSRTNSLNNLLQSLEQTEDMHFKINGRRITVMK